ncbi:hypothetical protein TNCV_2614831 [Trichonephila clavipes]|nr:hypothetical protein TNCV_2614831 [Trichonephila clavipes]
MAVFVCVDLSSSLQSFGYSWWPRYLSSYSHELVAGVLWTRVLLPLKTRRVDEAIPLADVVVRKEGCHLRCPPRHSTEVQNYEVCDQ